MRFGLTISIHANGHLPVQPAQSNGCDGLAGKDAVIHHPPPLKDGDLLRMGNVLLTYRAG